VEYDIEEWFVQQQAAVVIAALPWLRLAKNGSRDTRTRIESPFHFARPKRKQRRRHGERRTPWEASHVQVDET
jgi:hypothetical protein